MIKRLICGMVMCAAACTMQVPRALAGANVIVAVVNNDVITQKDVDEFARFVRLRSQMQGGVAPQLDSQQMDEVVQSLIRDRLILQEAQRKNVRVDNSRVKARIDELRRQYGSEAAFQEALSAQGLVQSDVESRVRESLMQVFIIDSEVRKKITIKPSEVTDFYEAHKALFVVPQTREFVSAALKTEDEALQIKKDCDSGITLENAAKIRGASTSTLTAEQGGQLKRSIEEAVFATDLGKVSAPVIDGETYYLFQPLQVTPEKQENLSEVQQKIATTLFNAKMEKELEQWVAELRKKAYVKIGEQTEGKK